MVNKSIFCLILQSKPSMCKPEAGEILLHSQGFLRSAFVTAITTGWFAKKRAKKVKKCLLNYLSIQFPSTLTID